MATLNQIREGLHQARDYLSEGWHRLHERASQALTRFTPAHSGTLESPADQLGHLGSRWGLLAAEISEGDDSVTVRIEAPGMESGDFELTLLDNDILVIRGEKHVAREQTRGRYHTMECAYGHFERAIQLPVTVDDSNTQASYRRGVLQVTLPKRLPQQRRRIEVEVE